LNKLRVVELFAGIGSWSKALENLHVPHEVVLAVDNDKYPITAYNAIHNANFEPIDISELDERSVPDCDVICYSPPCVSFSSAGKQLGFEDKRGILFFDALRIIKEKKPKYALMENVKNLAGKKFKNEFTSMLEELEKVGYKNYWKVLNAKDYGIPQNRERLFLISVRDDINQEFTFPEPIEYKTKFKDVLETDPNIIKNHIHSQKAIDYMNRVTRDGRTHWDFKHHNDTKDDNSHCLTANIHKGVPYNVVVDRRPELIDFLEEDATVPILHNIYGGFKETAARKFEEYSPTIRTSAGGVTYQA
jgi:DNA (cytosine-5)-methyltransferase 1